MTSIPETYQALSIGLAFGVVVGWILGRLTAGNRPEPETPAPPAIPERIEANAPIKLVVNGKNVEIPADALAEVQAYIRADNTIEAIKRLREATGLGLAAARSVTQSLKNVMK